MSLTSIFANQDRLRRTLESLLRQSRPPDLVAVYLSEQPHLRDSGFSGQRITDDALREFFDSNEDRVRLHWVENTGPYRKLLPLLAELRGVGSDWRIITVDDDLEYRPDVIAELLGSGAPCACLRGFDMGVENPRHLLEWDYHARRRITAGSSRYNFSTGVGGVMYSLSAFEGVLDVLLDDSIYLECCPTNDDIWFNFLRLVNGVPMTVVDAPYVEKDWTNKGTSLWQRFNYRQNDEQIRATARRLDRLGLL